jgi:hypothetical protein
VELKLLFKVMLSPDLSLNRTRVELKLMTAGAGWARAGGLIEPECIETLARLGYDAAGSSLNRTRVELKHYYERRYLKEAEYS